MNRIILGTAQFGLPYGINNPNGKIHPAEAFKILDFAAEAGVKYLDTAPAYGDSEKILGLYLSGNRDHGLEVITKFSFKDSPTCESSLMRSLENLRSERIHTILFHSFQDYLEHRSELLDFIAKYKNKLFDLLGVSVYTNDEIYTLLSDPLIDTVQAPFNLLDNTYQRGEAFRALKLAGKTVHTRSVFLQGLFFKPEAEFPESLIELLEPIRKIKAIANDYQLSLYQLALAYSLSKPWIDAILIGVDSLSHLKDNLKAATQEIPVSIIEEIDNLRIEDRELLNPSKWRM